MDNFNLVTVKNPKAPISEAYKTLRTNIQFSSFDGKVKVILVTSACPGDGKSITSANLAVVMAQSGSKTLLIDCDQRKPSLHRVFQLSNTNGLSDILVKENGFESALAYSVMENLHVLTSGTKPPNPSELLGSKNMNSLINSLRDVYDYIILDTPPILVVTDAQVISKYCDGCLLVVSSGKTENSEVLKAKEALEKVNSKILGVVLNKVKVNSRGYYNKDYYYGDENKENKIKTKKTKTKKIKEKQIEKKIIEEKQIDLPILP